MFGIRPQEHHLLAAPVGYSKTQHPGVELRDAIDVRRVEDDMAHGPWRNVLRMRIVVVAGHTRRKLDTPTVQIDETQSITAARLIERMWLLDESYACVFQLDGRAAYRSIVGHCIGDVVQSFCPASVKAQQKILWRRAPEEDGIVVLNHSLQPPNVRIKTGVFLQTRRKETDMTDLSDVESHIHRCTTFSCKRSSRLRIWGTICRAATSKHPPHPPRLTTIVPQS